MWYCIVILSLNSRESLPVCWQGLADALGSDVTALMTQLGSVREISSVVLLHQWDKLDAAFFQASRNVCVLTGWNSSWIPFPQFQQQREGPLWDGQIVGLNPWSKSSNQHLPAWHPATKVGRSLTFFFLKSLLFIVCNCFALKFCDDFSSLVERRLSVPLSPVFFLLSGANWLKELSLDLLLTRHDIAVIHGCTKKMILLHFVCRRTTFYFLNLWESCSGARWELIYEEHVLCTALNLSEWHSAPGWIPLWSGVLTVHFIADGQFSEFVHDLHSEGISLFNRNIFDIPAQKSQILEDHNDNNSML